MSNEPPLSCNGLPLPRAERDRSLGCVRLIGAGESPPQAGDEPFEPDLVVRDRRRRPSQRAVNGWIVGPEHGQQVSTHPISQHARIHICLIGEPAEAARLAVGHGVRATNGQKWPHQREWRRVGCVTLKGACWQPFQLAHPAEAGSTAAPEQMQEHRLRHVICRVAGGYNGWQFLTVLLGQPEQRLVSSETCSLLDATTLGGGQRRHVHGQARRTERRTSRPRSSRGRRRQLRSAVTGDRHGRRSAVLWRAASPRQAHRASRVSLRRRRLRRRSVGWSGRARSA